MDLPDFCFAEVGIFVLSQKKIKFATKVARNDYANN